MELLAPAGGFPAFEAALEAGADAVYVGAPGFNARALSRDCTFAEIGSMIRQAHSAGRRVYIAMNSLVKESELPAALDALSCFESLRPDALIIQDLGLLQLARAHFSRLALHASTLLSVHNSLAAAELSKLGCSRVVLAREMTIEEIAAVHRSAKAELEVFVHGAMCFSYSGLCLFSSLHGGKSSLRGQCVQPCRRRYAWRQQGGWAASGSSAAGYLFSMNDLCGIDLLPALRQAGVACLKIEGRLKSAQYVRSVVAAYRLALDALDGPEAARQEAVRQAHGLIDEAMGRKHSSGYLLSSAPKEAVSPEQPGSSGLFLGRIKGAQQEKAGGQTRILLRLTLAAPLNEGDRLRLHDERSGGRHSFTLRALTVAGQRQKSAQAGQRVEIAISAGQPGALEGLDRAMQGSLFRVDVCGRLAAERSGRQRSKELADTRILPDRNKVAGILRQLAWTADANAPEQRHRRPPRPAAARDTMPCWVMLRSLADLRERLPLTPQRILLPLNRDNLRQLDQTGGRLKAQQAKLVWQLPPILHEAELAWMKEQIARLRLAGWGRFCLGHCTQIGLFPLPQKGLELFGHYTLNLLNSAALHAALPFGLRGVLFSVETEAANLAAALRHFRQRHPSAALDIGMYAYGHPPLFTSRLDGGHFHWQQLVISPKEEQFRLERRDGLTLARAAQPFSLLQKRQELAAAGVDFLVLDCSAGPLQREAAALSALLGKEGGRRRNRPEMPGRSFLPPF